MPNGYQVVYLNPAMQAIKRIFHQSIEKGLENKVTASAQFIEEQLRLNPRDFGDPNGTLPKMKLDLYSRAVSPLMVYFGVHQTKPIVFVQRIGVFPFSGL